MPEPYWNDRTPEHLMQAMARAVTACDPGAVVSSLRLLAVNDPYQARAVCESMLAVLAEPGKRS